MVLRLAIRQPHPELDPALDGVQEELERGARVADIGRGHGASTIIMAKAYPHLAILRLRRAPCLHRAGARAGRGSGRIGSDPFAMATGTDYPGSSDDLVATFDCLDDMGDPARSIAHTREGARAGRYGDAGRTSGRSICRR